MQANTERSHYDNRRQGIKAFVPDELTATNAPYRFLTDPSGVRVQVAEEDAETARQVISDQAKAG